MMSIWQSIRRWFSFRPDPLVEMVRTLDQRRRPDHYVFAHHALRQLAFGDPQGCFAVLSSEHAAAAIADICRRVQVDYKSQNPALTPILPGEIHVRSVRIRDLPCLMIEMPAAQCETEAYLVAIVLVQPGEDDEPSASHERASLRYFTLEKALVGDGSPATLIGEWSESAHAIVGGGVPADVEQFRQALERMLFDT